jgi:hypothetical protein
MGLTRCKIWKKNPTKLSQDKPRLKLRREEYGSLRHRVLERDGWRCQICGSSADLQVHHQRFRSKLGDDALQFDLALCLLSSSATWAQTITRISSIPKHLVHTSQLSDQWQKMNTTPLPLPSESSTNTATQCNAPTCTLLVQRRCVRSERNHLAQAATRF